MFASLAFLLIGLDEVVLGLFLLIFVWDFVLSTPLSLGIFDFQGCLIPGPFSALWMKGTNFSPQFSFLVFLRHLSRKTRLKQVLLLNRKFAFLHFLQLTYIEFLIGWDVILLLPVSPSPAEWPRDLPRKTEPWRLKWSQDLRKMVRFQVQQKQWFSYLLSVLVSAFYLYHSMTQSAWFGCYVGVFWLTLLATSLFESYV